MQVAASSSAVRVPCASTRLAGSRSSLGSIAGLTPVYRTRQSRAAVTVRAEKQQVSFEQVMSLIEPHSQHISAPKASAFVADDAMSSAACNAPHGWYECKRPVNRLSQWKRAPHHAEQRLRLGTPTADRGHSAVNQCECTHTGRSAHQRRPLHWNAGGESEHCSSQLLPEPVSCLILNPIASALVQHVLLCMPVLLYHMSFVWKCVVTS